MNTNKLGCLYTHIHTDVHTHTVHTITGLVRSFSSFMGRGRVLVKHGIFLGHCQDLSIYFITFHHKLAFPFSLGLFITLNNIIIKVSMSYYRAEIVLFTLRKC